MVNLTRMLSVGHQAFVIVPPRTGWGWCWLRTYILILIYVSNGEVPINADWALVPSPCLKVSLAVRVDQSQLSV